MCLTASLTKESLWRWQSELDLLLHSQGYRVFGLVLDLRRSSELLGYRARTLPGLRKIYQLTNQLMHPATAFFIGSAFTLTFLATWYLAQRDADKDAGVKLGNKDQE